MEVAPIVYIGVALSPFLIWLVAFATLCVSYRVRLRRLRHEQPRQQLRRSFFGQVRTMTVVWGVAGCVITVASLVWVFLL